MHGRGRLRAALCVALSALVAPAAASAFDPATEAANVAKTQERFLYESGTPAYQLMLRTKGTAAGFEVLPITAGDGPAQADGRNFYGSLCWSHWDGCAGDVRYYDWDKDADHLGKPVLFTARNGSTISGHVWSTVSGPAKRPGVVITNGSVQAPEELYAFAAAALAEAGYVVLTWDPQGQGRSDTFGASGADALDGVPSQAGQPFFDGTEDALDFFFSTPARPYLPRRSCSTGTRHTGKQRARVKQGLNAAYDPSFALLDTARVGIVGHSLGAAAVSYVGQLDPRVKAIVAYDNLSAPGTSSFDQTIACPSGASRRPAHPPIVKPALGLSADYSLVVTPNAGDPDPQAKNAAFLAYRKAGVDTGEITIRGGTHFDFSYIPNPGFPASLRGMDLAAWYTTAWLDRYVKGDPSADARLRTDRWRHDARDAAVDPGGKGNLLSFYYRSRLDLTTSDGQRVRCDDLRAGCVALAPDGLGDYTYLAAGGLTAGARPSAPTVPPLPAAAPVLRSRTTR